MVTAPRLQSDGRPVRVLLVEDEPLIRMDLAESLRQAGYQVIEAAKADTAMEFIQAGERIDVVLTDVQTPGVLDGLALAERVRAKLPTVPVIITSGNSNIEDAASRLGKFLPKPYQVSGVASLIAAVIGSLP